MQLLAVGDKIIAKKLQGETQSESGLHLTTNRANRFNEALVLDVAETFNTVIKRGDKIRYHSTVFEYEDGIIILREDHIAAIVKD